MYSQVIFMRPHPDKTAELIKELGERNRISNGEGFPHMVAQQMLTQGPRLLSATQFQDLESLQKWYESTATDSAFHASADRIRATLSELTRLELHEVLAQSEQTGKTNYFLTATSFAAPGKARELRVALEKSFDGPSPAGAVVRVLQRQIAPEEGGACTVSYGFSGLAGLEAVMHDPSFGIGGAAVAPLLYRPVRQRLYRVLMPFARP